MKITEKQFKDIIEEEIKKALLTEADRISFYKFIKLGKKDDKFELFFTKTLCAEAGLLGLSPAKCPDKPAALTKPAFKAGESYKGKFINNKEVEIQTEPIMGKGKVVRKKTKVDLGQMIEDQAKILGAANPDKFGEGTYPTAEYFIDYEKSTVTREGLEPKTISAILANPDVMRPKKAEPKKKKAIQYRVCKDLPIELGCKGKTTRNLQRYLYRVLSGTLRKEVKQLNEFTLPSRWQDFVTGEYNKETEEAVKAFQEKFKMASSGVVDDKTFDKLGGEINTGKYAPLKKTTTTPPAVIGTPKAKVPVPVDKPKEPEAQTTTPTAPTGDDQRLYGLGALGGDKFADAVRRAKYAAPPRAATAVAPTAAATPPTARTPAALQRSIAMAKKAYDDNLKELKALKAQVATLTQQINNPKNRYEKSAEDDNKIRLAGLQSELATTQKEFQDAAEKLRVLRLQKIEGPPAAGATALDQKQIAALLAKNIEMVKKFPPESQGRGVGRVDLDQKCRYANVDSTRTGQICKQDMVCIKRHDGKPVTYWSPTGRCKKPIAPTE